MSSIEFNTCTRSIKDLVNRYNNDLIQIPDHQRNPSVWTETKRRLFIDSCKYGMPFPSILLYVDDDEQMYIEDGLQRLTTLRDFMNNEFTDLNDCKYSEWSETEKRVFEKYPVPTLMYSGATEYDRVLIFDRFQNGSPLKTGERLHALGNTSFGVLVKFTREMLMKTVNGDGKYLARAQNVWGTIKCDKQSDKRYGELANNVALMNGVVHGWNSSCGITKNYEDLREKLNVPISEFMRHEAERVLDALFSIYEEADVQKPLQGKKYKMVQKNIGNFTGAIVYSLKTYPTDWARLHNGWVNFIVSYRENNRLLETKIKSHVKACRNWTEERWNTTYMSVFNILELSDQSRSESASDTSDNED